MDFDIGPEDFRVGGVLGEDLADADRELKEAEEGLGKTPEDRYLEEIEKPEPTKISIREANRSSNRRYKTPFLRWVDDVCSGKVGLNDDITLEDDEW